MLKEYNPYESKNKKQRIAVISVVILLILCIPFGYRFYCRYHLINRDKETYISGDYKKLHKGSIAAEFFPEYSELKDCTDVSFLYKDLSKTISLHKYYTFYMLDVYYNSERYDEEKESLSKILEDVDPEYNMIDDFFVSRVKPDERFYKNNLACICFNDQENIVRYVIFCKMKFDENISAQAYKAISWHAGKDWLTTPVEDNLLEVA